MPQHQFVFDELLEQYTGGREPLENWTTEDLIRLIDAADRELQSRGERISTELYPGDEESAWQEYLADTSSVASEEYYDGEDDDD
jgi:hypothetical protein